MTVDDWQPVTQALAAWDGIGLLNGIPTQTRADFLEVAATAWKMSSQEAKAEHERWLAAVLCLPDFEVTVEAAAIRIWVGGEAILRMERAR